MKISISVPGRFHAFDMALQLQRTSELEQIITSYPVYKVKNFGIDASLAKSIISKEIMYRIFQKITGLNSDNILINDWFDWIASKKINFHSDIYVIWSGFALETIKAVRRKNPRAKIVIERGSTHIKFQREILEYAYKNFPHIKPALPSSAVITKEMQEYEQADYIAVPTFFAKKTFVEKGIPERKIMVTPYGVDLLAFSAKDFTAKETLEILFVGHFSVRKGAGTFIEILKKTEGLHKLHFNIVGNIEQGLMDYIKPFIISKRLSYTSHVPQNELPAYYQKADVFLFPSFEEGMAMVLLQAMACGLCAIATPNSGAAMVVQDGENGFLIQPEDTAGIIQLLTGLQRDPLKLAEMGWKARQSVQNGFTWDDYGKKIIQNYKSITGQ